MDVSTDIDEICCRHILLLTVYLKDLEFVFEDIQKEGKASWNHGMN